MTTISGYAARFNSPTQIGDMFVERLARGCFARSLREQPDVKCLLDHDSGRVLGRTTAGTLKLREDNIGLFFSVEIDDTTPEGMTAKGAVGRGDLSQCSFGFSVRAETWVEGVDGVLPQRTITDAELIEVSIVAFPAYEDTSAALVRERGKEASFRRAEAAMRRRGLL